MADEEWEDSPPRTPPPRGYGDDVWYDDHMETKQCLINTFREGMFCQPLEGHNDAAKREANYRYDEIVLLTTTVLEDGNFASEISATTIEGRKIRESVGRDWRKQVFRTWPEYQQIPKAWFERYSVGFIQHLRENEKRKRSSKALKATRKYGNPISAPVIAPSSSGAPSIQSRSSNNSSLTSTSSVPPFIVGIQGYSTPVIAPSSSDALNPKPAAAAIATPLQRRAHSPSSKSRPKYDTL